MMRIRSNRCNHRFLMLFTLLSLSWNCLLGLQLNKFRRVPAFKTSSHRFDCRVVKQHRISDLLVRSQTLREWPRSYVVVKSITSLKISGTDDSSLDKAKDDLDVLKKQQLIKTYQIAQYTFALSSFILFLMPDRTMTALLANKLAGAAGFGVASGLFYILGGACSHDRLGSDTYKRMNLGLCGFSLIGLAAVPGESGFVTSSNQAIALTVILTIVKLFGAATSFIGWNRGVNCSSVMAYRKELRNGLVETLKGFKVMDFKKALTYRNCLLLVLIGLVSCFLEGIFYMRYRTAFNRVFSWFEISLQWSAVSRLFMISTMIYSLKDAAERDRLLGTTFIQMNFMVGAWALVSAIGMSIRPGGFIASRGTAMFALSLPFFLKAVKSQIKKGKET